MIRSTLETRRTGLPETTSLEETAVVFSWTSYRPEDHLGSTRMVLDETGEPVEATMYQPYGTMVPVGSATSALPVREKFTTKEFDEEGGTVAGVGDGLNLFYFGARFYDPEVGVWGSVDPAEQSWNSYGYCLGNPIVYTDPDGQAVPWQAIFGGIVGGLIGAHIGGSIANGTPDIREWDWNDKGTYGGLFLGSMIGSMVGSGAGYLAGTGLFEVGIGTAVLIEGQQIWLMFNMPATPRDEPRPTEPVVKPDDKRKTESPDDETIQDNPGGVGSDGKTGTNGGGGDILLEPPISTIYRELRHPIAFVPERGWTELKDQYVSSPTLSWNLDWNGPSFSPGYLQKQELLRVTETFYGWESKYSVSGISTTGFSIPISAGAPGPNGGLFYVNVNKKANQQMVGQTQMGVGFKMQYEFSARRLTQPAVDVTEELIRSFGKVNPLMGGGGVMGPGPGLIFP